MFLIITITALCLVLVFADLKPRYRQDKKVFWVYTGFLAAAFFLWVLIGLDVKVPSPAEPIRSALLALFGIR